ncbi:MAG: hypothetical protein AMXMBFR84_28390 [Candidatus Hydrogenedentota bacterium]
MDLVISPDGARKAALAIAGEIRFGPAYYCLTLGNTRFVGRIFGSGAVWSGDSRFLAVQEWHSVDEAEGPITSLALFDFLDGRECKVETARAFVVPQHFAEWVLHYTIEQWDTGQRVAVHQSADVRLLSAWANFT